jgi:hypothetical protein
MCTACELVIRLLKPETTLCQPDGPLLKYSQLLDILNTLNVQPHIILLLKV